jgi:hypothetical protein
MHKYLRIRSTFPVLYERNKMLLCAFLKTGKKVCYTKFTL